MAANQRLTSSTSGLPKKSLLNMNKTSEMIYAIRDLNRKFRLCCSQLIMINNLIDETETRYKRAQAVGRRSYRYILRLKLCTLEGVRNQFYEYAYSSADKLEEMQLDLYRKTGIAWNEAMNEDNDEEDRDIDSDDCLDSDEDDDEDEAQNLPEDVEVDLATAAEAWSDMEVGSDNDE